MTSPSAGSAPTNSPASPPPAPQAAPSSVPVHPGLLVVIEKGSAPGGGVACLPGGRRR